MHALAYPLSLEGFKRCSLFSFHTSPSSKNSFFQIGTVAFSSSINHLTASKEASRCADETAIITKKIAGYADSSPDSIAIYFEDKEITYRELINGANQYSHWFLDNGLQKGDVVALLMENRPEFLMAWIGIAQVGGTSALINTNLTGHPLNHSLSISGASKLILGKELISNFETTDDTIKGSFQVWVEGDINKQNYNLDINMLEDYLKKIMQK